MRMEGKTYDELELKKHNSVDDLWIAIHGKVYDVTEFRTKVGRRTY